ncbi:MAG: DUF4136 domain-containing protein [Verrucomicrobiia bacterium]
MKTIISSLLAVSALLLAGCSSTPTQVNKGPIHAGTFSFVSGRPAPPEYAEKRAQIHKLIQNAITANLAAQDLTRVSSSRNVIVAYLIILGDNVSTTDVNDYFGYGRDSDALLDKAHQAGAIDSQNPNHFVAGTLVIDVIDAKTYKLLYRNYAVRHVLRNVPDDVRAERVQAAVDQALAGLKVIH